MHLYCKTQKIDLFMHLDCLIVIRICYFICPTSLMENLSVRMENSWFSSHKLLEKVHIYFTLCLINNPHGEFANTMMAHFSQQIDDPIFI